MQRCLPRRQTLGTTCWQHLLQTARMAKRHEWLVLRSAWACRRCQEAPAAIFSHDGSGHAAEASSTSAAQSCCSVYRSTLRQIAFMGWRSKERGRRLTISAASSSSNASRPRFWPTLATSCRRCMIGREMARARSSGSNSGNIRLSSLGSSSNFRLTTDSVNCRNACERVYRHSSSALVAIFFLHTRKPLLSPCKQKSQKLTSFLAGA